MVTAGLVTAPTVGLATVDVTASDFATVAAGAAATSIGGAGGDGIADGIADGVTGGMETRGAGGADTVTIAIIGAARVSPASGGGIVSTATATTINPMTVLPIVTFSPESKTRRDGGGAGGVGDDVESGAVMTVPERRASRI